MKKLILAIISTSLMGCGSMSSLFTSDKATQPVSTKPVFNPITPSQLVTVNFQKFTVINLNSFDSKNGYFTAKTSTPIVLGDKYLPTGTTLTGTCHSFRKSFIDRINGQQVDKHINLVTQNSNFESVKCSNVSSNVSVISIVNDTTNQINSSNLKDTPKVFKNVNFESSGYDFNVKAIQTNGIQYNISVQKTGNFSPPIVMLSESGIYKSVNFRMIESDGLFKYQVDSAPKKIIFQLEDQQEILNVL